MTTTHIEKEYGLRDNGVYRFVSQDPDNFESYRQTNWQTGRELPIDVQNNTLCFPMDHRTTAAPNGIDDYVHYANGGLSWAVPYLAGLYALGVQVYPALTKEIFMQAARDTANTQTCTYQGEKFTARYFVNPTALINRLKELNNAK